MNCIYLVIKEGVYRHDIFCAFTDKNKALDEAKRLAYTDIDSHHTYVVQPVEINAMCDINTCDYSGHKAVELEEIARYRK